MSEERIIIRGLYQNNLKHVPLDIPKGRMVDRSNTVIVIAHNLDVMKQADWSIDVGPVGGSEAAVTICK